MQLVGQKKPANISIALIENAADVAQEGNNAWLYENRTMIMAHGFMVERVDLRHYPKTRTASLREHLKQYDVIWLGGGNTYYLRWILQDTGADQVIVNLARQGKIYGGASAGAIMAGPTLQHFETADDPREAPEHLINGLGLTKTVVVPHWASADYGKIMQAIDKNLWAEGFLTQHLTDDQALIINDQHCIIIE